MTQDLPPSIASLLDRFQGNVRKHIEFAEGDSTEGDSTGNDAEARETQLKTIKKETCDVLVSLFLEISSTPKEELGESTRETIQERVLLADFPKTISKEKDILAKYVKHGLISVLAHPRVYRAFLGLPKVTEQTRRYLCGLGEKRLEEIYGMNQNQKNQQQEKDDGKDDGKDGEKDGEKDN